MAENDPTELQVPDLLYHPFNQKQVEVGHLGEAARQTENFHLVKQENLPPDGVTQKIEETCNKVDKKDRVPVALALLSYAKDVALQVSSAADFSDLPDHPDRIGFYRKDEARLWEYLKSWFEHGLNSSPSDNERVVEQLSQLRQDATLSSFEALPLHMAFLIGRHVRGYGQPTAQNAREIITTMLRQDTPKSDHRVEDNVAEQVVANMSLILDAGATYNSEQTNFHTGMGVKDKPDFIDKQALRMFGEWMGRGGAIDNPNDSTTQTFEQLLEEKIASNIRAIAEKQGENALNEWILGNILRPMFNIPVEMDREDAIVDIKRQMDVLSPKLLKLAAGTSGVKLPENIDKVLKTAYLLIQAVGTGVVAKV